MTVGKKQVSPVVLCGIVGAVIAALLIVGFVWFRGQEGGTREAQGTFTRQQQEQLMRETIMGLRQPAPPSAP